MSDPIYDVVLRGGTVATATDIFQADVAVRGETVAALGTNLPQGRSEIDAAGKLVLPGGVDAHAHIEQVSANGMLNADTWESGPHLAQSLHDLRPAAAARRADARPDEHCP